MTCPRHQDLSLYSDGMMQPAAQARFEHHLQGCPTCRHRLDALRALRRSLHALPSPALGFDLSSRLQERLRTRRPQPRPPSRWPTWSGWVPAGVAVGMALASGVWLGSLLMGGGAASVPRPSMLGVFDPVPPGGLCAAAELCRLQKGMP